ncbi:MAG: putative DNA binding domain-containing protein [Patescibacteria group bacterium]|nr:putative DNA binding domain-containing protein [Patescibacteria group bacterium]
MRKVVVREGPLVFIRNVIVMEIFAAAVMYVISFLENYGAIYQSLGLSRYIRFDILEIIIFSGFQLVYITFLFFEWYFTRFEITDREIIRRSGLLFRHHKSVSLKAVTSVEIYQSPLDRMMTHHASLIFEHGNGRITKIRNVPDYDEHIYMIKSMVQEATGRVLSKDPSELIRSGEGLFVEFKQTMRYDARKGEISKELEKMVLKTIVAFLNSDGGTLLIGVDDAGRVTGLHDDYKTLSKKNRDGFENHLTTLVKTAIGMPFAKYVRPAFESVGGKDICVVSVGDAHKPAYLRNGDKHEEFFVRVGNSTQPFSMSEAEEYIKTHWR